jgi:hypothetical protein
LLKPALVKSKVLDLDRVRPAIGAPRGDAEKRSFEIAALHAVPRLGERAKLRSQHKNAEAQQSFNGKSHFLGPLSFGAGVESLVGFDSELVLSVDSPVEGF